MGYAVKEVENESLDDEENLEALETEVRTDGVSGGSASTSVAFCVGVFGRGADGG